MGWAQTWSVKVVKLFRHLAVTRLLGESLPDGIERMNCTAQHKMSKIIILGGFADLKKEVNMASQRAKVTRIQSGLSKIHVAFCPVKSYFEPNFQSKNYLLKMFHVQIIRGFLVIFVATGKIYFSVILCPNI